MSIKLLARDLYRYQKLVEQLEEELAKAPVGKRPPLEEKLRKAKHEKEMLRKALDGHIGR
jgi:hypothetical protein